MDSGFVAHGCVCHAMTAADVQLSITKKNKENSMSALYDLIDKVAETNPQLAKAIANEVKAYTD